MKPDKMTKEQTTVALLEVLQRYGFSATPAEPEGSSFALSREPIKRQFKDWFRGILESNDDLAAVLSHLRDSYCALLAGRKPAKNDDELLAQVEAALTKAEKARSLFV